MAAAENRSSLVLLVEDDPQLCDLLELQLKRAGHEVIKARDGEDALARINGHIPGVIITDLMMPVMDGYALIAAVRKSERLGHIPIIAISASIGDDIREKAFSAGANEFLRKPFDFSLLQQCLLKLLPA